MESGIARERMSIGEYNKILPKLLEKISAESKDKYLPENTPIFMQWIVKDLALLDSNRHPLPNTKSHAYQQRLCNWAQREPERLICLFYIGYGLNEKQKQQIEDLEKLSPNIRVIDFNTLDLKEYDFSFEHPSLGGITISNYYKNLYSISEIQRISFGREIDLMRVLILLKAGGALIESGKAKPEEIPESKAAIYFDFDILPNKEGKKIGKVKIPEDILVSQSGNGIENAIMAVSEPDNSVLQDILKIQAKNTDIGGDGHGVYHLTKSALTKFITDKYLADGNLSLDKLYDSESKWQLADGILRSKPIKYYDDISIFGFEYNSVSSDFQYDHELDDPKTNVMVSFDQSWKSPKRVYEGEDLPINFDHSASLEQTIMQKATNSRAIYK